MPMHQTMLGSKKPKDNLFSLKVLPELGNKNVENQLSICEHELRQATTEAEAKVRHLIHETDEAMDREMERRTQIVERDHVTIGNATRLLDKWLQCQKSKSASLLDTRVKIEASLTKVWPQIELHLAKLQTMIETDRKKMWDVIEELQRENSKLKEQSTQKINDQGLSDLKQVNNQGLSDLKKILEDSRVNIQTVNDSNIRVAKLEGQLLLTESSLQDQQSMVEGLRKSTSDLSQQLGRCSDQVQALKKNEKSLEAKIKQLTESNHNLEQGKIARESDRTDLIQRLDTSEASVDRLTQVERELMAMRVQMPDLDVNKIRVILQTLEEWKVVAEGIQTLSSQIFVLEPLVTAQLTSTRSMSILEELVHHTKDYQTKLDDSSRLQVENSDLHNVLAGVMDLLNGVETEAVQQLLAREPVLHRSIQTKAEKIFELMEINKRADGYYKGLHDRVRRISSDAASQFKDLGPKAALIDDVVQQLLESADEAKKIPQIQEEKDLSDCRFNGLRDLIKGVQTDDSRMLELSADTRVLWQAVLKFREDAERIPVLEKAHSVRGLHLKGLLDLVNGITSVESKIFANTDRDCEQLAKSIQRDAKLLNDLRAHFDGLKGYINQTDSKEARQFPVLSKVSRSLSATIDDLRIGKERVVLLEFELTKRNNTIVSLNNIIGRLQAEVDGKNLNARNNSSTTEMDEPTKRLSIETSTKADLFAKLKAAQDDLGTAALQRVDIQEMFDRLIKDKNQAVEEAESWKLAAKYPRDPRFPLLEATIARMIEPEAHQLVVGQKADLERSHRKVQDELVTLKTITAANQEAIEKQREQSAANKLELERANAELRSFNADLKANNVRLEETARGHEEDRHREVNTRVELAKSRAECEALKKELERLRAKVSTPQRSANIVQAASSTPLPSSRQTSLNFGLETPSSMATSRTSVSIGSRGSPLGAVQINPVVGPMGVDTTVRHYVPTGVPAFGEQSTSVQPVASASSSVPSTMAGSSMLVPASARQYRFLVDGTLEHGTLSDDVEDALIKQMDDHILQWTKNTKIKNWSALTPNSDTRCANVRTKGLPYSKAPLGRNDNIVTFACEKCYKVKAPCTLVGRR